ncbi:putative nucleotide-binding protein containing TIR-like domain protein [Caballeronia temeraria]|uniref:Nucleotide-binding protein containing TIR-like domain protein n=2 Tax=Caballeronia temeraria TaxID=1777137 RepID=A0A158AEN7_9BURK|nr:putative nucleotide-binding protein containing TIR-like domain protein [Caballeronia temeraria]
MFIGSSVEGLPVAEAMQHNLSYTVDSVLWSQGVFDLSKNTLASLIQTAKACDFALFILSPDDLTKLRKEEHKTARDNVLLEFGLFAGLLGQDRVFFVVPSDDEFHLPTDLLGLTAAKYFPGGHGGNLFAALGTASTLVKQAIAKLTKPLAGYTNLSGSWRGMWGFTRESYPAQNEFEADVIHVGDTIRTAFESNGERYDLTGKIHRGSFITGMWGHPDAGASYFGPFQLVISPNGRTLTGKWCGFGRDVTVDAGPFVWERVQTSNES